MAPAGEAQALSSLLFRAAIAGARAGAILGPQGTLIVAGVTVLTTLAIYEYQTGQISQTLGSLATVFQQQSGSTPDQDAAIQLAKDAKNRGGLSQDEAEALVEQAREAGLPVRGPESHPDRPNQGTHIHIGPINHIPVR